MFSPLGGVIGFEGANTTSPFQIRMRRRHPSGPACTSPAQAAGSARLLGRWRRRGRVQPGEPGPRRQWRRAACLERYDSNGVESTREPEAVLESRTPQTRPAYI